MILYKLLQKMFVRSSGIPGMKWKSIGTLGEKPMPTSEMGRGTNPVAYGFLPERFLEPASFVHKKYVLV